MKSIRVFGVWIVIGLLSCYARPPKLIGTYKSQKVTLIDQLIHFRRSFVIGNSLIIRPDSTFRYEMCGLYSEGRWFLKDDSLILCMQLNFAKKDSTPLNTLRPVYLVREKYLEGTYLKDEKETIIDRLVRTEN